MLYSKQTTRNLSNMEPKQVGNFKHHHSTTIKEISMGLEFPGAWVTKPSPLMWVAVAFPQVSSEGIYIEESHQPAPLEVASYKAKTAVEPNNPLPKTTDLF